LAETETVLITGGAGFVGSAVAREALARGRRVVVLDDLSFGRAALLPEHAALTLVRGDVRDPATTRRLLRIHEPHAVIHLAAIHFIPYCNAHPVEAMDVNVNGTRAVLAACRERPPRRLVFASTAAVYPAEGGPFTEEVPAAPLDVYGYTKLMGEDLCRLFSLETGVPTRIARLFNVFGPADTNAHLIPDLETQARAGTTIRLGNLDPIRDYVHVSDVAAALLTLLDRSTAGVETFNVGSGEGRSVRQVVAAFEAALGRPLVVEQEEARVRKVERLSLVASTARLRADSPWRPRVSFEAGVRDLVSSWS
jgi:UDP-glucose 4-epimerase